MATVRFRGPIFDNPGPAMRRAAGPGLKNLGAQIEATVKLNSPSRSGELRRSVDSVVWRDNRGLSVKSTLKVKRKTWSERGTRRGVKLGPAYYMWRKGKAKAKDSNKQGLLAADIAKGLNG
jgi:hypothetical protein